MASNYTSNYGLCQWEPNDKVLRTEFNADNAKIDAAIAAVDGRVSSLSTGKASISALNSLKNTVNSLSETVSAHGTALEHRGNCEVEVATYTGDGKSTRTHTFPRKPVMVMILEGQTLVLTYGQESVVSALGGGNSHWLAAEWSGNSFTLRCKSSQASNEASAIANFYGNTYRMLVFYDMSV